MDLVIDLHNTTSDCGYALMMRRDDALSHALCATLQKQYSDIRGPGGRGGAAADCQGRAHGGHFLRVERARDDVAARS